MREFTSLAAFAAATAKMTVDLEEAKTSALEKGAQIIEDEAKRVLGTYDYGWPPLKPATIARKANGDTPLLESGEMRGSIEHTVKGDMAHIGSNNDKAVWHELGTPKVPPRPFLSGAAAAKGKEIADLLGRRAHTALTGSER